MPGRAVLASEKKQARIKATVMVYKLARSLQLIGLALLPVAMAGNLADKLSERGMLLLTGAGIGIFLAGWLLQQAVKSR